MPSSPSPRRVRRLVVLAALAPALAATSVVAPARAAQAAADASVSSNWAGYAVTRSATASNRRFRRVSGTWRVPAVTCSRTATGTYAASWVGLGGYDERSSALEQTGTEMDCDADGGAHYSAWYELVPSASRTIAMRVRAGDTMAASVAVRGTTVRVELRDRTTGARFVRSLTMAAPDTTSAEWITEAPSACTSSSESSCTVLPLSAFGTMSFVHASATDALGRTGAIADAAWTPTAIALSAGSDRGGPEEASADDATTTASPSALATTGTSFSVASGAADASAADVVEAPALRVGTP